MKNIKIYKVEFEGVWPVGSTLILAAYSPEQAKEMALSTIKHTSDFKIIEVNLNEPRIIEYLSGDY